MVWTAIGLTVLLLIAVSVALSENRHIQEIHAELAAERAARAQAEDQITALMRGHEEELASLRGRLAQKSVKPEEKVIHARNAGDVRRKFEQAVGEKP